MKEVQNMKKTMTKALALLLTMLMLLSAVPFALAEEPACSHADNNGDNVCDLCTEAMPGDEDPSEPTDPPADPPADPEDPDDTCDHVDVDENGFCDDCFEEMPDPNAPCEHVDVNRDNKCDKCNEDIPVVCEHVDDNADGKCDDCGEPVTEEEVVKGKIICHQDGYETASSSANLMFTLTGADPANVQWSFSVSGSCEPEITEKSSNGKTASVTVVADTIGTAKITVIATWENDGMATATCYVSFYSRIAPTLYVKEGTKSFRFTDTDVFSKISNVHPDKVKNYSLYYYLSDGHATAVSLYESRKTNADVGLITYKTTQSFKQYDPDEYNDYNIADLDKLTFTILGEGTYKLDFELYAYGGATTKGSLNIVVGEPGETTSDLVYRTKAGKSVTFATKDFEDYWENHVDSRYEYLDYVKFEPNSKGYGLLYLDSKERGIVQSSYKFMVEPEGKPNTYDLNDVTYKPDPREERYTETIDFVAYGDRNTVLRGEVTVIVGGVMPFADVKTSDWFYDEVLYVYDEGIMNGTSDTAFSPNGTLTRGMVVTMLYRVEGEPSVSGKADFSDVAGSAWYADAVAWAAENDIVNGMGNGKLAPDAAITREQFATILYRYAKTQRMSTSFGGTSLEDFADDHKVSAYAEDAMKWAVYAKIMEGSANNLNPKNTATRAEAAAMLQRFLEQDEE